MLRLRTHSSASFPALSGVFTGFGLPSSRLTGGHGTGLSDIERDSDLESSSDEEESGTSSSSGEEVSDEEEKKTEGDETAQGSQGHGKEADSMESLEGKEAGDGSDFGTSMGEGVHPLQQLYTNLGKQISLLDHYKCRWHGVLTS